MGETLAELQVRAFWAQMNSSRRRAEGDDLSREAVDPQDPPFPEQVTSCLRDLVDTLNMFAAFEPKLAELDVLKRDPAQREATEAMLDAARELSRGAASMPAAVERSAADSMLQVAADATGPSPAAERAAQFTVRSARNLALELIRRPYKWLLAEAGAGMKFVREGAYRHIGGTVAIGAIGTVAFYAALLVKTYEPAIRTLVDSLGGGANLHRIIDLIVQSVS